MKIIIGLGNPGKQYQTTRHNAGSLAVDYYLNHAQLEPLNAKMILDWLVITYGEKNAQTILFCQTKDYKKFQVFMNETGSIIKKLSAFYKIDVHKDLLIIHDDSDLPLGAIRATASSSSAGHNGVQDIIDQLGTQDFHRIRIGVETRQSRDQLPTDVFVLQNFSGDELKKLRAEAFPKVKLEIEKFIQN